MSNGCCTPGPGNDWEGMFGTRQASADLRDYRRHGPARHTARLIELISAEGVAGATLVDVGGGVGAIGHALLERGLASAPTSMPPVRIWTPPGRKPRVAGWPTGSASCTATSWPSRHRSRPPTSSRSIA